MIKSPPVPNFALTLSANDNAVQTVVIPANITLPPEDIVQQVISYLVPLGYNHVRNLSENKESMTFKLPRELVD